MPRFLSRHQEKPFGTTSPQPQSSTPSPSSLFLDVAATQARSESIPVSTVSYIKLITKSKLSDDHCAIFAYQAVKRADVNIQVLCLLVRAPGMEVSLYWSQLF